MFMSAHGLQDYRATGRRHCRRGGLAILETILVMPLLLMVSFGAAEYSDYFYVKNALAGAARDGVRTAILSAATESTVTTAVDSSLGVSGVPSADCTITTSPTDISTASQGSAVTVTITATWSSVGVSPLPLYLGGISPSKQISVSAVMMKE